MSLQKHLLSLEKKTDKKNRDEAYWKAREESQDEVDHVYDKIRTWIAFILGVIIFCAGANRIFEKINWLEIQAPVHTVSQKKISKDDDLFERYRTKYTVRYQVGGRYFLVSAIALGKPRYGVGEKIPVLVDPRDPNEAVIKYALIEEHLVWIGIGAVFLVMSSYYLFFKGRKKASLAPSRPEKRLQKNPRRGL